MIVYVSYYEWILQVNNFFSHFKLHGRWYSKNVENVRGESFNIYIYSFFNSGARLLKNWLVILEDILILMTIGSF